MSTVVVVVAKRTYGTGRLGVKHGSWYGRWRTDDGRELNRKIGTVKVGRKEGLTKIEAEAKLREMMLAETGVAPADAEMPTVERLGELLIDRLKILNRKTSHIEGSESNHRKHINPLLGNMPAELVNEKDVERLVRKMSRQGLSPKTIRNVIGTLHSSLALVRPKDNPCDMATLPKVRKSNKIRFLTSEELERVLDAEPRDDEEIIASFPADRKWGGPSAARTWWPVVRLLVLVSASSGMRLGELRGWRWSNLDLGAMRIRVEETFVRGQFDSPKSDESFRSIPLARRLLDELDEHHKRSRWNQDDDLVFAHPLTGRPLDRVRLLLHVHAACRRAGVREIGVHDLRHTFATTIVMSGKVPLRTLQEWLGHEDIRTTQRYAAFMAQPGDNDLLDEALGDPTGRKRGAIFDNTPPQSTR